MVALFTCQILQEKSTEIKGTYTVLWLYLNHLHSLTARLIFCIPFMTLYRFWRVPPPSFL